MMGTQIVLVAKCKTKIAQSAVRDFAHAHPTALGMGLLYRVAWKQSRSNGPKGGPLLQARTPSQLFFQAARRGILIFATFHCNIPFRE
jgi:hypothetical protein